MSNNPYNVIKEDEEQEELKTKSQLFPSSNKSTSSATIVPIKVTQSQQQNEPLLDPSSSSSSSSTPSSNRNKKAPLIPPAASHLSLAIPASSPTNATTTPARPFASPSSRSSIRVPPLSSRSLSSSPSAGTKGEKKRWNRNMEIVAVKSAAITASISPSHSKIITSARLGTKTGGEIGTIGGVNSELGSEAQARSKPTFVPTSHGVNSVDADGPTSDRGTGAGTGTGATTGIKRKVTGGGKGEAGEGTYIPTEGGPTYSMKRPSVSITDWKPYDKHKNSGNAVVPIRSHSSASTSSFTSATSPATRIHRNESKTIKPRIAATTSHQYDTTTTSTGLSRCTKIQNWFNSCIQIQSGSKVEQLILYLFHTMNHSYYHAFSIFLTVCSLFIYFYFPFYYFSLFFSGNCN